MATRFTAATSTLSAGILTLVLVVYAAAAAINKTA